MPDKAAPPEALNTCGTEELGNNKAEELLPQNISDQEYTACDQQQSRMESLSILTGNVSIYFADFCFVFLSLLSFFNKNKCLHFTNDCLYTESACE